MDSINTQMIKYEDSCFNISDFGRQKELNQNVRKACIDHEKFNQLIESGKLNVNLLRNQVWKR